MKKILQPLNTLRSKISKKIKLKKIPHRKISFVFIIAIIVFLSVSFILFYLFILRGLPDPRGLKNYKVIPVSSQILDRNGKLLFEVYKDQNRIPIKIKSLPKYISQATISIEDKSFYQHEGISLFGGVARAIKDMFILKRGLQGGSTITQQLVKSALLSPERTIQRKLKEMVLALWTERILSKDEILELYLNQVPYGGLSYGIESAAQNFFGKSAKKLTLSEAALLAGLPQAPSYYSPYASPYRAKQRRKEVLTSMVEEGYITKAQAEEASEERINVKPFRTKIEAPHFVFYVKSILEKQYGGQTVEEGGLKIYTTLDLTLQKKAEKIVNEELEEIRRLKVSNAAALITRPPTGEILAMVGSADYYATQSGTYNVTTALRQPGSSIKPLHYAVAMDMGLVNAASVYLDAPTCFPGPKRYCPRNYDGRFHGPVQLRFALANSYNIPAVKNMALLGVEQFIASSEALLMTTFKDPSRYGVSLGLGGGEVRMTEMAQAFSAFANEGVPKKLVAVLKVEDKKGKVIYEYKDPNIVDDITKPLSYPNFLAIGGARAFSKETAFIISHILLDNNARAAAFGARSALVIPDRAVSVKTGTTNDLRDNWTIGYTPNFLTAVWVGNNDNSPMNPYLTSGITGAAPIWNGIMTEVLDKQPNLMPRKPDGVVGRQVCSGTGGMMTRSDEGAESCASRFEYFAKGTEGAQSKALAVVREMIPVNRDTGKQTTIDDPAHEMREMTLYKDQFTSYCLDCAHDTPGSENQQEGQ